MVDKNRKDRPTIKRIFTGNRLLSVATIAATYNSHTSKKVFPSTVQRILKKYDLRSYTAFQETILKFEPSPIGYAARGAFLVTEFEF